MAEAANMSFGKSVVDVIRARKSIRTYRSDPIPDDLLDKISDYISGIEGPFPVPIRFQLVSAVPGEPGSVEPGASAIKGALTYLAAAVRNEGRCYEQLGYAMEKAILFITSLGLGTCWLGGTFNRTSFERALGVLPEEILPCVTPIGFPAEKKGLIDALIRKGASSHKREPWSAMFFRDRFGSPLTPEDAGPYAEPFEMLRLSPSASNKQPWRVAMVGGRCHVYLQRTPGYPKFTHHDIQRIDPGIAMCHFELTARECGLRGHWAMVKPIVENTPMGIEYIASWVPDK
ncbi:MAG: nitroreductase family protein [Christensenellales bacterium]|jgi:nitroreductase